MAFLKKNSQINSSNIATGIKSLGILQLLSNGGYLNKESFLIIDEPEVHLHPQWEIEYANIVVSLAEAGVPIILSSHSPYFIQALIKNVRDKELQSKTKIYFGKKSQNNKSSSCFDDVTNDLEPIFKALSKPMQEIYSN